MPLSIEQAIWESRRIESEATEGPWHRMSGAEWNVLDDKGIRIAIMGSDNNFALDGLPDAYFIVHARNTHRLLLDVAEACLRYHTFDSWDEVPGSVVEMRKRKVLNDALQAFAAYMSGETK